MCFSARIVDTDVINLILTDVPDIDSRNAEQGLVPLMISGLAGKRHAVKWFVRRGLLYLHISIKTYFNSFEFDHNFK